MQLLFELFIYYWNLVCNFLVEIGSHLVEGHAKVCCSIEEDVADNKEAIAAVTNAILRSSKRAARNINCFDFDHYL
jgi:hypothetical protein